MRYFRLLALPPLGLLLAAVAVLLATEWAVARASHRVADVAYVSASAPDFDAQRHRLDVYQPTQKAAAPRPVVLFIHGGSWNSGGKDDILYKAIGRRLAKNGFVGVVISYRLSPQVQVPQQADDCARALAWTVAHITEYGGDPARIVLMGHSAGGGLAALLATGSDTLLARHGLPRTAAHAVLLDDPAGLDMLDYLTKMQYAATRSTWCPSAKTRRCGGRLRRSTTCAPARRPTASTSAAKLTPALRKAASGFGSGWRSWGQRLGTRFCPARSTWAWSRSCYGLVMSYMMSCGGWRSRRITTLSATQWAR